MARMIPANFPDLDPDETRSRKSERKVFNLLKNAPGTEGWIVLYSVLLPDERPDAKRRRRKPESDFVILVPDYGFVCLEVKGGEGRIARDGTWYRWDDMDAPDEGPFKQAAANMSILLYKLSGSSLNDYHMFEAVLFTDLEFKGDALNFAVFDKMQMNRRGLTLVRAIRDEFDRIISNDSKRHRPDANVVQRAARCLQPDWKGHYPLRSIVDDLNELTKKEYYRLLGILEDNSDAQWIVFGDAGSGKTKMALEYAHSVKEKHTGLSIAMVCSSQRVEGYMDYKSKLSNSDIMVIKCDDDISEIEKVPSSSVGYLIIDDAHLLCREPFLEQFDRILHLGLSRNPWVMFGEGYIDGSNIILRDMRDANTKIDVNKALGSYAYPRLGKFRLSIRCRNTVEIRRAADLCLPDEEYSESEKKLNADREELVAGRPVSYHYWENQAQMCDILSNIIAELCDDISDIRSTDVAVLSLRSLAETGLDSTRRYGGWVLLPMSDGAAQLAFDVPALRFDVIESFEGIKCNVVILVIDELRDDHDWWQAYNGMLRARADLFVLAHSSLHNVLEYDE